MTTELPKKGKQIGRGMFTRCYELGADKVLLESQCSAKECMSLGWFPESRLFPEVERLDYGGNHSVYTMKRYPKQRGVLKHLDEKDAALYRELRELFKAINFIDYPEYGEALLAGFDALKEDFPEESEALIGAYEAMRNYGQDVFFEISPRNVTTENGKLILLDCWFMGWQLKEKIEEIHKKHKIRNRRGY